MFAEATLSNFKMLRAIRFKARGSNIFFRAKFPYVCPVTFSIDVIAKMQPQFLMKKTYLLKRYTVYILVIKFINFASYYTLDNLTYLSVLLNITCNFEISVFTVALVE